MNRFEVDLDGQVDGDASPYGSPFVSSMNAQPLQLNVGTPPWHLWGNTLALPINSGGFGTLDQISGQLDKVSYGRPDSWHWLFSAVITRLSPLPIVPQVVGLQLDFDVTIGIGRSMTQIRSFETFRWEFDGVGASLVNFPIWSNSTRAPNRFQSTLVAPTAVANEIREIVAQDIQVSLRVNPTLANNYVYTAELEVSGYWAPKTHVRPDWMLLDVPPGMQFPGAEIGGR